MNQKLFLYCDNKLFVAIDYQQKNKYNCLKN